MIGDSQERRSSGSVRLQNCVGVGAGVEQLLQRREVRCEGTRAQLADRPLQRADEAALASGALERTPTPEDRKSCSRPVAGRNALNLVGLSKQYVA